MHIRWLAFNPNILNYSFNSHSRVYVPIGTRFELEVDCGKIALLFLLYVWSPLF